MPPVISAPRPDRIAAAVRRVVEKLAPDQIILFGSGARREMTTSSDLDLLVLKRDAGGNASRPRHERWECPDTGRHIDVVVMDQETAERHRRSASHVQGAALDEGHTVYVRDGAAAVPRLPNDRLLLGMQGSMSELAGV